MSWSWTFPVPCRRRSTSNRRSLRSSRSSTMVFMTWLCMVFHVLCGDVVVMALHTPFRAPSLPLSMPLTRSVTKHRRRTVPDMTRSPCSWFFSQPQNTPPHAAETALSHDVVRSATDGLCLTHSMILVSPHDTPPHPPTPPRSDTVMCPPQ